MKKINPVIASVLSQRANILNNIKMAELSIEKDKNSISEIDDYFGNNPDFKRYIEISSLEGHQLLEAAISYLSGVHDKLKTYTEGNDDRVRHLSDFINHLRHIEVDYSDVLVSGQNVWSACLQHLGYLDVGTLETIDADIWVHRALQETLIRVNSMDAMKAQMRNADVLTPSTRQGVNFNSRGGMVMGNGTSARTAMMNGGPMYNTPGIW